MTTNIPFGDPKAVSRWSASLFLATKMKSYFEKKFISENSNAIIQRKTELEQGPGDTIKYDLSVELRGLPTTGDNILQGNEEDLSFSSSQIQIDQLRHAVSCGGAMTRQRTVHDLRKTARERLSDYFAKLIDEMFFIYLSGSRGNNNNYLYPVSYVGHAENPILAPDEAHLIYSGNATSRAALTADDKMSRNVIERAANKARTLNNENPDDSNIPPVNINGESHYVCVMSPHQEYDLRNSDKGGWLEIQKAAAAAEGRNNPIFKGGLGMINNVVLHSHEKVICSTGGTNNKVPTARALFLGQQSGVVAYGGRETKASKNNPRFSWNEKLTDYGDKPNIAAGTIIGIAKTRFNGSDFAVLSIDTAASNPNAR